MRAGLDAVQTERTVHVPRLARKKQVHFTTPMMSIAAQTIVRRASRACLVTPDPDLQGRNKRAEEIELADRTHVFTEAGTCEQTVYKESSREIADEDPGCEKRAVPKVECLGGRE